MTMKKIFILLAMILTATLAFTQTTATVSGTLVDQSETATSQGISVDVTLVNTGSQRCFVNGTGTVVTEKKNYTAAQILAGITLAKNASIVCGSSSGQTRWRFSFKNSQLNMSRDCDLQITGNTSLNTATCLQAAATPPNTPVPTSSLFLLLDGSNSMTGNLVPAVNGTQSIGTSGSRWNMFANTLDVSSSLTTPTIIGPAGAAVNVRGGAGTTFAFAVQNSTNTTNLLIVDNAGNISTPSSFAVSSAGAVTAQSVAATAGTPLTLLSGATGTNLATTWGRTAAEANMGVIANAGNFFTNADLVAGDFFLRLSSPTNRIYLGAGTAAAPLVVSNTGIQAASIAQQASTAFTIKDNQGGTRLSIPSGGVAQAQINNTSLTGVSTSNSVNLFTSGCTPQGPTASINGTGAAADIFTCSLLASTVENLKILHVICSTVHDTGTANVAININLNGQNIASGSTGTAATQSSSLEAYVLRTGTTTGQTWGATPNTTGVMTPFSVGLAGLAWTSNQTLNCQFTVAAGDHITGRVWAPMSIQ